MMIRKLLFIVILLRSVGYTSPMVLNNLSGFTLKEHESISALTYFQQHFNVETDEYTLGYNRLLTMVKNNEQSFQKLAVLSDVEDKRDLFMGWFHDLVKAPIIENGIAQQHDSKICINILQEQITKEKLQTDRRSELLNDINYRLIKIQKKLRSPASSLLYYFGLNPLLRAYRWYTNSKIEHYLALASRGERSLKEHRKTTDNTLLNAYDFLVKSSVYNEFEQSDNYETIKNIIKILKDTLSVQDQELTVQDRDDRPDSDIEEHPVNEDAITPLVHEYSNEPSTSGSSASCTEPCTIDYSLTCKPVVAQYGNNCGYHALFNAVNVDENLISEKLEKDFYEFMEESKSKVQKASIGDRSNSWTLELLQEDEMEMLKNGLSQEIKKRFVIIPDIHRYVKGDGPLDNDVLSYLESSQDAIFHYKNLPEGKIIKHIFVLGTMDGLMSKCAHWIALKQEIDNSGIRYSIMDSSLKDFVHPIAERFVKKVLHGKERYYALSSEDSQSMRVVSKDLNYFKILNLGIYSFASSGGTDIIEVYRILPSEIIQKILEGCLNLLELEIFKTHKVAYGDFGKFDFRTTLKNICDRILECNGASLNYTMFIKDSPVFEYKLVLNEGQLRIIEYIQKKLGA